MKNSCLLLMSILFILNFSYAQNTLPPSGNVGIGTTTPASLLDVGKLLNSGELSTVLARLSEGNWTGGGTYLGVRGYDTQPTANTTGINDIKSFSIEHSFYGLTNSSINFLRGGGGTTGGSISFNTNDNTEKMRILSNGNIGIGTSSPGAKLDVNGSQRLNGDLTFANDQIAYFIHGPGNGGAIRIRSNATAAVDRNLQFGNIDDNGVWYSYMIVDQTGNVGIGTTIPDSKLSINGTIHSKEVKVDMNILPDYVFQPTYDLPSLKAVKAYVDQYHHLPDIPSAQQVAKEGLNLGEMNAVLLKKVEELTLYLIEKDKQVADQQKVNASLQEQINQLARAKK